jgi:hypothetical protein
MSHLVRIQKGLSVADQENRFLLIVRTVCTKKVAQFTEKNKQ